MGTIVRDVASRRVGYTTTAIRHRSGDAATKTRAPEKGQGELVSSPFSDFDFEEKHPELRSPKKWADGRPRKPAEKRIFSFIAIRCGNRINHSNNNDDEDDADGDDDDHETSNSNSNCFDNNSNINSKHNNDISMLIILAHLIIPLFIH